MKPDGARPNCPSYPDCLNSLDWKPEHCVDCEYYELWDEIWGDD